MGLGFPHLGMLISSGLLPPKAPLWSIRFPLVPLVCRKTFYTRSAGYPEFRRFLLWLRPRYKLPDSFRCPYIYGVATEIVDIRSIQLGLWYISGIARVVFVWPGAAHAPIGVTVNPNMYSMQQQKRSCHISSRSVDIWENGAR